MTADPLATLKYKSAIIEVISTVYDPEIPVNIWELGLIYDVSVDTGSVAHIRMTLTAPNCPSAQSLPVEVQQKVKGIEGLKDADVEVVWEPAWNKDMMSDTAKLQLGIW